MKMRSAKRSKDDHRDPNVERIQNRLEELGFDVGDTDGHFGYLTREAVRECQIAYKLKADGIVGRAMLDLLSEDIVPSRLSYVAAKGDTLKSIANTLNTSVEAILEANVEKTYRSVYQGDRLRIYKRVLINSSDIYNAMFTFNCVKGFSINLQGFLEILDVSVPDKALLMIESDNIENTRLFLRKSLKKQSLDELIKKTVDSGAKGIVIDFPKVEEEDSGRFTKFVVKLGEESKKKGLKLCIILPPEVFCEDNSSIGRGYDVSLLEKSADFMIAQYPVGKHLELDIEKCNDGKFFRGWMEKVCKNIPRWKIIISIYVGKYKHADGDIILVSQEEADGIKAKHYTRSSRDERMGVSYFRFRAKGKYVKIWFEDKKSFAFKLHQINRHNVIGVAIRGLDSESEDILAEVQKKFIII